MPETPLLNMAGILPETRKGGPGVRDMLWVRGCSLRCPGCGNAVLWDAEPARRIAVAQLLEYFARRVGTIHGCTISGGEPTDQPEAVAALLKGVQALGLSTILYSGRLLEEIEKDSALAGLLSYTDLLVDGPFRIEFQDRNRPWVGSTNQRFHYLTDRFSTMTQVSSLGDAHEIFITERGLLIRALISGH